MPGLKTATSFIKTKVTHEPAHHETTIATCPSCGHSMNENFCGNCGEKRLNKHDFAVAHYLEESFEGITHFDNKFFRTVKLLLASPGKLSVYFSQGKRTAYMRPFQLFVVCNILYFFLVGSHNNFSLRLYNFYNYEPFISLGTKATIDKIAPTNERHDLIMAAFDSKMGTDSKTYIIFFIPVLALGCFLLFNNSRRYFSEHLVFATHFFSFILLLFTFEQYLIAIPFYYLTQVEFSAWYDTSVTLLTMLVLAIVFYIAAKRFYNKSIIQTALGSMVVIAIFMASFLAYRVLLFYKIIYSLHL